MNGKTLLGALGGLAVAVGLSACGAAAEPSATSSSVATSAAATTAAAKTADPAALKTECAVFNTAFEAFIDQATEAGKLVLGAGADAASEAKGIKDLATAYQAWGQEMSKQAGAATAPELKTALTAYAPLVKGQAEQLAALKGTDFTSITLEAKANEAQLKVANLCA